MKISPDWSKESVFSYSKKISIVLLAIFIFFLASSFIFWFFQIILPPFSNIGNNVTDLMGYIGNNFTEPVKKIPRLNIGFAVFSFLLFYFVFDNKKIKNGVIKQLVSVEIVLIIITPFLLYGGILYIPSLSYNIGEYIKCQSARSEFKLEDGCYLYSENYNKKCQDDSECNGGYCEVKNKDEVIKAWNENFADKDSSRLWGEKKVSRSEWKMKTNININGQCSLFKEENPYLSKEEIRPCDNPEFILSDKDFIRVKYADLCCRCFS